MIMKQNSLINFFLNVACHRKVQIPLDDIKDMVGSDLRTSAKTKVGNLSNAIVFDRVPQDTHELRIERNRRLAKIFYEVTPPFSRKPQCLIFIGGIVEHDRDSDTIVLTVDQLHRGPMDLKRGADPICQQAQFVTKRTVMSALHRIKLARSNKCLINKNNVFDTVKIDESNFEYETFHVADVSPRFQIDI